MASSSGGVTLPTAASTATMCPAQRGRPRAGKTRRPPKGEALHTWTRKVPVPFLSPTTGLLNLFSIPNPVVDCWTFSPNAWRGTDVQGVVYRGSVYDCLAECQVFLFGHFLQKSSQKHHNLPRNGLTASSSAGALTTTAASPGRPRLATPPLTSTSQVLQCLCQTSLVSRYFMCLGHRMGLGPGPDRQHCFCYELEAAYEPDGTRDVGDVVGLPSPMACQDACKENAECRFWNYHTMGHPTWPGWCIFKNRGQEKVQGVANIISGPRICPHIAPWFFYIEVDHVSFFLFDQVKVIQNDKNTRNDMNRISSNRIFACSFIPYIMEGRGGGCDKDNFESDKVGF